MVYPDPSFLGALYIAQSGSAQAVRFMGKQTTALAATSLLSYEFRQSVQFQVFRHNQDSGQGYPEKTARMALAALHLGAAKFLTLDANQKKLAQAEGMTVPF